MPRPCTRSCGFDGFGAIPSAGADSIISSPCGAISGFPGFPVSALAPPAPANRIFKNALRRGLDAPRTRETPVKQDDFLSFPFPNRAFSIGYGGNRESARGEGGEYFFPGFRAAALDRQAFPRRDSLRPKRHGEDRRSPFLASPSPRGATPRWIGFERRAKRLRRNRTTRSPFRMALEQR